MPNEVSNTLSSIMEYSKSTVRMKSTVSRFKSRSSSSTVCLSRSNPSTVWRTRIKLKKEKQLLTMMTKRAFARCACSSQKTLYLCHVVISAFAKDAQTFSNRRHRFALCVDSILLVLSLSNAKTETNHYYTYRTSALQSETNHYYTVQKKVIIYER